MKASTSRRAALGTILAAPLASVPVLTAPASMPAYEAEFIAWATSSIPEMLTRDRIWARARELYAEIKKDFPASKSNNAILENSSVWAAYLEARRPSEEISERLAEGFERFEKQRMRNPLGILLKLHCYRAIHEDCEGEDFRDLDAFIAEAPKCA